MVHLSKGVGRRKPLLEDCGIGLWSSLGLSSSLIPVVDHLELARDSITLLLFHYYFNIIIRKLNWGFGVLGFWGIQSD